MPEAGQILKSDRKIGILHLPGESFLQAMLEVPRGIEMQFSVREEGGIEEGEALDVIPMGMADTEMQA
jgi:hypothetical protein